MPENTQSFEDVLVSLGMSSKESDPRMKDLGKRIMTQLRGEVDRVVVACYAADRLDENMTALALAGDTDGTLVFADVIDVPDATISRIRSACYSNAVQNKRIKNVSFIRVNDHNGNAFALVVKRLNTSN